MVNHSTEHARYELAKARTKAALDQAMDGTGTWSEYEAAADERTIAHREYLDAREREQRRASCG